MRNAPLFIGVLLSLVITGLLLVPGAKAKRKEKAITQLERLHKVPTELFDSLVGHAHSQGGESKPRSLIVVITKPGFMYAGYSNPTLKVGHYTLAAPVPADKNWTMLREILMNYRLSKSMFNAQIYYDRFRTQPALIAREHSKIPIGNLPKIRKALEQSDQIISRALKLGMKVNQYYGKMSDGTCIELNGKDPWFYETTDTLIREAK